MTGFGMDLLSRTELDRIALRLHDAGVTPQGTLEAEPITGGRSNLTFRLTDGTTRWVLRTPPRGGRTPSAHDVAREHRVTSALAQAQVPVARPVLLCEDSSLIGGPFSIATFVDGRTVQSRRDLQSLDDDQVLALMTELTATLAAIHAVDHVAVGLGSFGRPGSYGSRQLARWSRQWEIVGTEELRPLAQELTERLGLAAPEQRSVSVVHGDYRVDNVILAPVPDPRIAAVVDWELSTIGDPVADVAMMCAYRHSAFDLVVGEPAAWTSPRLPDVATMLRLYAAAGGADLDGWSFHLGLAHFKIAVIAAGIDHRRRAGSGQGAGFDSAAAAVSPYLEAGLAAVAEV